jgi:hypothetical protein
LRTIKTARFYGRGFFVCPLPKGEETSEKLFETKTLVLVFKVDFNPKPWFGVEKLLNDKIFIFWRSGVFCMPPKGASEKLKLFYWLDGFYKNNQVTN